MKYLLVLIVIVVAYMLWRNSRANRALDRETDHSPP